MIVVLLDNASIGAGPATVVAIVSSVAEYLAIADKDGVRDPHLRLLKGDATLGARVMMRQEWADEATAFVAARRSRKRW
jgi:hypothetical protein